MSERPTRLKIGPLRYTVEWRDKEWEDSHNAYGATNNDYQIIRLSTACHPDRQAETFLHEVTHALWSLFQMKQSESIDNEQCAYMSGLGWLMFWRDNPEALQWWIQLLTREDSNGSKDLQG
jgi:hypothetical protein